MGWILVSQGDLDRLGVLVDEALGLAQNVADRSAMGLSLTHLGGAAVFARGSAEGRRLLHEALRHAEVLQDDFQIGWALAWLAVPSIVEGDHQEAAAMYSAAVSRFQAVAVAAREGYV
jgi:hypothetical protein